MYQLICMVQYLGYNMFSGQCLRWNVLVDVYETMYRSMFWYNVSVEMYGAMFRIQYTMCMIQFIGQC
jgi:hypothetical protein